MFAGTGGAGVKKMPSEHSEIMPKKCVACHMYRDEDYKITNKGSHTFLANYSSCLQCHKDPKEKVEEWRKKVSPLLEELKALLDKATDKTTKVYKDAILNYDIVISDGKMGFHNPKYAQAVLRHSIEAMTAELSKKSAKQDKQG